jgi:hypothetical protein
MGPKFLYFRFLVCILDWLFSEKIVSLIVQRVFATFGAFFGVVLNHRNSERFLIHLKLGGMPKTTLSVLADDR